MRLTTTVEGRQRFSVNARFGQDFRNNLESLKRLQVQTMKYGPVPLEAVADVKITEGPPMINSENAMLGERFYLMYGKGIWAVLLMRLKKNWIK